MKAGDFVRFREFELPNDPHRPKRKVGLLIEYNTWEKVATILYSGERLRIRSCDVEKAGKKDYGSR